MLALIFMSFLSTLRDGIERVSGVKAGSDSGENCTCSFSTRTRMKEEDLVRMLVIEQNAAGY